MQYQNHFDRTLEIGPRAHRRELRHTQAPAMPMAQHWAQPIERAPLRRYHIIRTALLTAASMMFVAAATSCATDDPGTDVAEMVQQVQHQQRIEVAQAAVEQDAQVLASREVLALAMLVGSKQ